MSTVIPAAVEVVELLHDARERAERALRRASPRIRTVRIANRDLQLRFATQELEDILFPALAHLEHPGAGSPSLTVSLVDAAAGGIDPPFALPYDDAGVQEGERWSYEDGERRVDWQPVSHVSLFYDRPAGAAWWFVDRAASLPWFERCTPLRFLLGYWTNDAGLLFVHAGAIGRGDRGLLLGGPKGSGKSTTTLRAVTRGWSFAGDDTVALELGDAVCAHSLFGHAKLEPGGAQRVPGIHARFVGAGDPGEKLVADVATQYPDQVRTAITVTGIVLPRVAPGPTHLAPVSGAVALRRLAPSSWAQLRGPGDATVLGGFAQLVRRVPAHELVLGDDGADEMALLEGLLHD